MASVSADECYSNVDSVEELRRICGERDEMIGKLKLLLVRKNKMISSLDEEIDYLKSENQAEVVVSQSDLSSEITDLKTSLSRQQADLDLSKKELETLSKMNSDLQRFLSVVKQERDVFKSEVDRITNDLVSANARTKELYEVASKIFESPSNISHSNPQSQHAFILSILRSLNAYSLNGQRKPDAALLTALHCVNDEINRLLGVRSSSNNPLTITSFDDVHRHLEQFTASLKQCSTPLPSFRLDKNRIITAFNALSRDRDELRFSFNNFSKNINSSLQCLLSSVDNLKKSPPKRANADALFEMLSEFKCDLTGIKDVISRSNLIVASHSSELIKRVSSILQYLPLKVQFCESISNDAKWKTTRSVLPYLQGDLLEVKSMARQYFTSLQSQINAIQHLHAKLMFELNINSIPPVRSETEKTPSSTSLEALLTDIWQLKDNLSGVKELVLEQSSRYHQDIKEVGAQHDKLLPHLQLEIARIQADVLNIRKNAAQLSRGFNRHFRCLSRLVQSLEVPPVKSPMDVYEQRFKDYDRLVRDKEAEIDQLRETCDRFSDECDRFGTVREALKQMISQDSSVNLTAMNSEDAALLNNLMIRLNHNQAARLELVEQTQAISSLQTDLAVKTSALETAVARATEAETSAAEALAKVTLLQEKLNCAKQLLSRARKDANEAEKKVGHVTDIEEELIRVRAELETSKRCFGDAVDAKSKLEQKLVDMREEKERIARRLTALQKQFDSYKVKALHALRNGSSKVEENTTPRGGSEVDEIPLSWRYECSNLAQTETARLKETVQELEASLAQTTSRLNSVCVELEAADFALAEEKEKCSRLSQNLQTERIQWCEERESLSAKWKSETANRMTELETALEYARNERNTALSEQAEELNVAFGAKIAELKLQLEAAEAKVEAQRIELLEHLKTSSSSIHTPANPQTVSPSPEPHLCTQCGRFLTVVTNGSNSPILRHRTRQFEEALFGKDNEELESETVQEAKKQISVLQETVQTLQSQLASERRNLEYTKNLLVDSEATVERLSAQANILKSEIRRHERNVERERHLGDSFPPASPTHSKSGNPTSEGVTRSEYLKNILLTFLCGPPGGSNVGGGRSISGRSGGSLERLALVPVLSTLLALAPNERAALQQVAQTGLLLYNCNSEIGGLSSDEGLEVGGATSSWSGLIGLPSWFGGG